MVLDITPNTKFVYSLQGLSFDSPFFELKIHFNMEEYE